MASRHAAGKIVRLRTKQFILYKFMGGKVKFVEVSNISISTF